MISKNKNEKIDENQNTILNIVEQIKDGYSKRYYSRAVLARKIQRAIE